MIPLTEILPLVPLTAEGIKELIKFWKVRRGNVYRVILKGEEKVIQVKEVLTDFPGALVIREVPYGTEDRIIRMNDLARTITKINKNEIKMLEIKTPDIIKAVSFIKSLTDNKGAVKSEMISPPLAGPSAQCLIALHRVKEQWGSNILPQDEFNKRVKWIVDLREWRDFHGNRSNCFVVSHCLQAVCEVFDKIKDVDLKKDALHAIEIEAEEILKHQNADEGGWSWSKEAVPPYPYYTFFALKALNDAQKILVHNKSLNKKIAEKKQIGIEYLNNYLNKMQEFLESKYVIQQIMAIWGKYEIKGDIIKDERYFENMYQIIDRMESLPMPTKPDFWINFFTPKAIIPMIKIAPDSTYTFNAIGKVIEWIKQNQNEGWGWYGFEGDTTWATAKVLMILIELVRNVKTFSSVFQ